MVSVFLVILFLMKKYISEDFMRKTLFAFFVLLLCNFSSAGVEQDVFIFFRGDANCDESVNISDPIYIGNYLFNGGPAPACDLAADANSDGNVSISDQVFLLNYLFDGGPALDGTVECIIN